VLYLLDALILFALAVCSAVSVPPVAPRLPGMLCAAVEAKTGNAQPVGLRRRQGA
jgi:hypothetical protein